MKTTPNIEAKEYELLRKYHAGILTWEETVNALDKYLRKQQSKNSD